MTDTREFQQMAARFRDLATRVAAEKSFLDGGVASACDHCGATRYRNWPQYQLLARVEGAAERLNEIAETLERRAHDAAFLTGVIIKEETTK